MKKSIRRVALLTAALMALSGAAALAELSFAGHVVAETTDTVNAPFGGLVDSVDVRAGDTVEVVGPDCKPFSMVVPEMRDAEGFTLLEPRNPRMIFTMQLPRSVPAMSFVRHAVDLSARD